MSSRSVNVDALTPTVGDETLLPVPNPSTQGSMGDPPRDGGASIRLTGEDIVRLGVGEPEGDR